LAIQDNQRYGDIQHACMGCRRGQAPPLGEVSRVIDGLRRCLALLPRSCSNPCCDGVFRVIYKDLLGVNVVEH
jgi:hypothetical protein